MIRHILICSVLGALMCQCNTLRRDCTAVAEREKAIARETPGDYFVGRRYYVPLTRFWGYLRKPGESWRKARLVIMDESVVRTPDRGYEPPVKGASLGRDRNVEYTIKGRYTGETAYEPSTNQVLPVFRATEYKVRNTRPGFLFTPSEEYSIEYITLRPEIMPNPSQCRSYLKQ